MGFNYQGKRPGVGATRGTFAETPTTATTLKANGKTYYLASTAAAKTWVLSAPSKVGMSLQIDCIKATTSLHCRVQTSACSFFTTVSSTATTKDTIRFNNAQQSITLVAYSTSKYRVSASHASPIIGST